MVLKRKIDPKQLAKGTRIEMREHRIPKRFARKIAGDHLRKHPRYYLRKR